MRPTLLIAALLIAAPAAADNASLRNAVVSAELYARGLTDADAVMILTAARLRKAAGLDQGPTGWPAMLDAASALARGDALLAGIIADVAAEGDKGVTSGAVLTYGEAVPGRLTSLPPYTFKAGDYAEIYVEAVSGGLLTITVHDAALNEVCREVDTAIAYCGWTPAQEGSFTVQIASSGSQITEFILMTN